jgi:hypothetical protein
MYFLFLNINAIEKIELFKLIMFYLLIINGKEI